MPVFSSRRSHFWLFSVLALAPASFLGVAATTPAAAQSGSENPAFQRHFWRGQHGHGNIDFEARRTSPTGPATAEALVEPGTPGAALARRASSCANRFASYDPATGTYVGRDGRTRACR